MNSNTDEGKPKQVKLKDHGLAQTLQSVNDNTRPNQDPTVSHNFSNRQVSVGSGSFGFGPPTTVKVATIETQGRKLRVRKVSSSKPGPEGVF